MFDIFYINDSKDETYKNLREKFFTLKFATSVFSAQQKATTKFFYTVYPDVIVDSSFLFDYIPDDYSQQYPHIFLNGDCYDGIALLPKTYPLSKNEVDYRFYVSKKEVPIIACTPRPYDIFIIDTMEQYQQALESSNTEMFFGVSSMVDIIEMPNVYFRVSKVEEYNRKANHAFKNICNGEEKYNGVFLFSKHHPVSRKELEHRHIVYKKSWDIVASRHKPYDVVFMSYNETNADEHYKELLKKAPHATRVHGVKGIHQAHIQAAKQSASEMVWIVDADAILMDDFDFELFIERWDRETVHVWRSKNPINDLVYGYGGLKLFPRLLTLNMDTSKPDMTTSITSKFKAMPKVSNITAFNTDPFNTWKSAFRECCKLSAKIIDRQKAKETEERLDIWCTVGKDKPFGKYAILGAKAGREYGYKNKDNVEELKKINDFDWLETVYNASNF